MKLFFNPSRCSQCHLCAYVCSYIQTGVPALENSALRLEGRLPISLEVIFSVCSHCSDQFCLDVCPTGALKLNRQRIISLDKDSCDGCHGKFLCEKACPFDGIFIDSQKRRAVKCDLCGGKPECISVCPQEVITLK